MTTKELVDSLIDHMIHGGNSDAKVMIYDPESEKMEEMTGYLSYNTSNSSVIEFCSETNGEDPEESVMLEVG